MHIKIIVLMVCVSRVLTESDTADTAGMEYLDGSIVENKDSLPSINVSDLSAELYNGTIEKNSVGLSRALDFYNTELLSANWNRIKMELSKECEKNMQEYIDGLAAGANWALKMDDASGRYSTGWFWGNHFWTGSQSLCENISPSNNPTSTNVSEVGASLNESSSMQYEKYQKIIMIPSTMPRFDLGYFILRISINSSFTDEERTVHVGLCIPDICTNEDAQFLFEETSRISKKVSLKVEAIRSKHQRYNMFEDVTFIVLCTVTAGVIVMLISGTIFDLYIQHLKKKKKTLVINCTTYSNTSNDLAENSYKA
ncbi:hypothetical protein RI129_002028 [Pyrocoelia pectoralis]|uniref:Nose resistant-to-fluoxetine protein N-terminal domain-containing protein n=1 Tax=Pyrocoelia pectoralis TaxID=417401 RepID=A0AAN7VWY8_9COLE